MSTKTTTFYTIALIVALSLPLAGLDRRWSHVGKSAAKALGENDPRAPSNAEISKNESKSPADQALEPVPPEPGLRLLRSDETGIVLELYTPYFQVKRQATGGLACDLLTVPGYATTDKSGWPQLPIRGAMLGIPPGVDVRLTVLGVDVTVQPERFEPCPVPSPIVEIAPTGEVRYQGTARTQDAQAYAADALSPASPAELVSTGFIRSQRVAQVRFHPLQYNPSSGALRHLRRIRVRLDFSRQGSQRPDTTAHVDEGPFEETLRNVVLNYDTARRWRIRPRRAPSQAALAGAQGQPQYKIVVNADGIYQVTYADLQAAGAEADGIDPRTLQLYNQGEEVAIYVDGEGDETFDPGDYLLFYGQKMNTRYTDDNVYWLTWGDENGRRMPVVDGTPTGTATTPTYFLTTQRVEEDHIYLSSRTSGPDNDHWYWSFVYAFGTPVWVNYDVTLPALAAEPFSATVRGLFRGYDAITEHHTRVHLNDHRIDEATWPPQTEHSFAITVPQSYLAEGPNTISVTCGISNTQDIIFVNWFEIDYYGAYTAGEDLLFFDGDQGGTWEYQASGFTTETLEVFDITAPLTPARILSATIQPGGGVYTLTFQHTITGEHHYLALAPAQRLTPLRIERDTPSDLHSAANGADYVIVTHGDFYTDVLPLAAHRAAQGLRTTVVDVQDIYDEFSHGIFDPTAIRDFLAYAYANWVPPAPAYVLLVGDGNYDFKNNYGYGEPNYLPPYLANVDPWIIETASDNQYVCVSGGDILPDMYIGRLPVRSSGETSTMVNQILNYEQNPPGGDWNQQVLFVTDDPDTAGDFYTLSDDIADQYLPVPYTPQKIYYGQPPYTSGSGTRAAIIAAINEGRLVVNYIGHAGANYWAAEKLLNVNSIALLTNAGRLPLMVPMTCMDGHFIYPSPPGQDYSSLGESIVRASGGGAIASWSPTGLGVAAGHDYLNRGLFEALFFDGVVRLGPATMQSKLYLYSNTGMYHDLLNTYVLFGDPALTLNVLPTDLALTKAVELPEEARPGDVITYTLVYTNAGPATAFHVVITDVLPVELISPSVLSAGAMITPHLGSRFVWDVADLAAGEGGIITVTATVSPTFLGPLSNTGSVAATVVEGSEENNTATVMATVAPHVYYLPVALNETGWPPSYPYTSYLPALLKEMGWLPP